MFNTVVNCIQRGISPLLYTAIEGERMGQTAVFDGENVFGESALFSPVDDDGVLPLVRDGVLIERITTPPHLILCGGGHVSMHTAKIAKMVGFRITVIDERAEFANRNRFPDADDIVNLPFKQALNKITDLNAYYVIVTRGHLADRECLETVLKKQHIYCGMIGSRGKTKLVFDKMREQGYSDEALQTVHAPIGLEIGANTPEEIAVSIAGELIQVKNSAERGSEWDESLCNAIRMESEPYAMVTLITKSGSAPRSTGARMIVKRDGTIISSIGGGYGEYEAARYAVDMLKSGSRQKRYSCYMNNTNAAEAGMICGGVIDIFIQTTNETVRARS